MTRCAWAFATSAGPFRSFGHIAVEPRPYQLVPLLMALKLDPVRLLIADDVGIGKTIEAGLIARELLDRGEIQRLAVLCPPHLAEQWQAELRDQVSHRRRTGAAGHRRPPGAHIGRRRVPFRPLPLRRRLDGLHQGQQVRDEFVRTPARSWSLSTRPTAAPMPTTSAAGDISATA